MKIKIFMGWDTFIEIDYTGTKQEFCEALMSQYKPNAQATFVKLDNFIVNINKIIFMEFKEEKK